MHLLEKLTATVSFPGNRGNLYAAAVIANIASVATGTHYTWSSPTIPKLQQADSWLPISDEEAAWLGSLTALGSVFGPYLAAWLINVYGGRRAIVVCVLLSTVAWLEILVSRNVWQIYIGKLLGGVAGGINCLACPLYVAEISENLQQIDGVGLGGLPTSVTWFKEKVEKFLGLELHQARFKESEVDVRGALGSLFGFFLIAGYVLEYIVGPFVSYWTLIYINLVPAVLFFATILLIPESPYFYLRQGDETSALKSFTWLRKGRTREEIREELLTTQDDVQRSMKIRHKVSELVTVRGNRMGLFIAGGIFTGQQISGVNTVLFFTQSIFIVADSSISSSGSTILVGSILFGARVFATPLVRRFGLKTVLIVSACGMAVFQFLLGLYSYFDDKGVDVSSYGWVPIATLVGYILFLTIGFGPLPWAVMAEVFPPNIKAVASSVTASYNWFVSFLMARYFTDLNDDFGPHVAFFLFSGGSVLALVFTAVFLPDTRGMTLQEVTFMLDGR